MGKGFEKYNNRYWECKQSQKGQSQKKVRESSQEKGEVEQKGWKFAKKMVGSWPQKWEPHRDRLLR